jgi:hypothetical protein
MKTKQIFAALTILSTLLFASISHATWITATNSGSWGDPTIWDSGTVPGTNDFAEVDSPYDVTVNTNAIVQYIFGSGTVTMAAGSILNITDPAGANGTYQLATLDTSAPSNTVIYSNNPFWAKHQNYYNLVFSNTVTASLIDFYNGFVNTLDPANAMTIAGDMTVIGKIKVQEGAAFTILGNLIMGTNSQWDCSSFNLTVVSNTVMGGLMLDLDGASGVNNFMGNMLIPSYAIGWNVSDVTQWAIGGSLTNNGLIVGKGYGSIAFDGTGIITGSKAITIPTMTINGTYTIGTTITLTTNTPTLNGTLVFDLANTNQIVFKTGSTNSTLYYSGNLNVINSGVPPMSGNSYKFFNATNYGGTFASTSFPSLPSGLSWVDNLATSGSIAVTGAIVGSPTLTLSRSGNLLTLSWDSTTFPGYRVQGQTNSAGIRTNWSATGSGTNSPFNITINPANPPVFFRLSNP